MRLIAPASRPWIMLAAIFALALGLRIAWVAATDTAIPPLSDPQYYHATATNLAEGRGYSVAVDERGFVSGQQSEPTAFWPPGYPLVLAPLYKLFGSDERIGKALNALAGALTVLAVFAIGRRSRRRAPPAPDSLHRTAATKHDDGVGLIAAVLFAASPALVFWTPALFSEPLFTLGVATTLAVGLWASDVVASERRDAAMAAAFVLGIVLAATAFVRSQGMLLVVPVAAMFVVAARERATATAHDHADVSAASRVLSVRAAIAHAAPMLAAVVAGMALLVAPWAIRNQRAMGSPYLINDNLGYNLRLAHGPYSNGTSTAPQDLWDERPGLSFYDRELFFTDEGTSRAITYAREHPGREIELATKRVGWLLRSDAEPALRWSGSLGRTHVPGPHDGWVLLGDAYWYALLALAAASLLVAPKTRVWAALWSLIAVWMALHLVFAGEPRYHVPLMPAFCVLAATTLVGFHRKEAKDAKGS